LDGLICIVVKCKHHVSPHHHHCAQRCMRAIATDGVVWSECVLVTIVNLATNSRRKPVSGVDSRRPKEPCTRPGARRPKRKGHFSGTHTTYQIGFTFLVTSHLGSPGKRAVKRVCVCVCVYTRQPFGKACIQYLHQPDATSACSRGVMLQRCWLLLPVSAHYSQSLS